MTFPEGNDSGMGFGNLSEQGERHADQYDKVHLFVMLAELLAG